MADAQVILDTTLARVVELQETVDDVTQRLESFATLPFQTWVDFAPAATFEPEKAERIDISGTMPTLEKLTPNFSLDQSTVERYNTHVWNDGHLDTMYAKLTAFIDNGGTGVSDAVQSALFNKEREKDLQTLNDALDIIAARHGQKGFPLPTSMMHAQQNEQIGKYHDLQAERAREITALIAERAQQNVQFAIKEGIGIEQAQMDFAIRYASLFRDISMALVEQFRAEQSARVAEFEGTLKVILADAEIAKANAGLDIAYQELLAKKWQGEIQNATEKTKALISQAGNATQVKLTAAQALAQTYGQLLAGLQTSGISVITKKS